MIVGAKQSLAQNIFVTRRNMNWSHTVLTDLYTGLIPLHESFLNITRATLLSLRVKEEQIQFL